MKRIISVAILLLTFSLLAFSQSKAKLSYKSVEFTVDTIEYTSQQNNVVYQDKQYHFVKLPRPDSEVKVEIYLTRPSFPVNFHLIKDEAISIKDTLEYDEEEEILSFSFLLRDKPFFRDDIVLEATDTLGKPTGQVLAIPMFVFVNTKVSGSTDAFDVFQEEEIAVDLPAINVWNVQADPVWRTNDEFDYKISKELNSIKVLVRSHLLGKRKLSIPLKTIHPILQTDGKIGTTLVDLEFRFQVKPNQIDFLNFDKEDIFFERQKLSNGEEIQMRNNSNLILKKTYRIEDTQEPGGKLIAEIFTRSILANGRVLCWIRPFSLHRVSEGYLYIKDGDRSRFVTNLNILERPRIDQVVVLRTNEDWSDKLYARPGEEVEIKIVGKGLLKTLVQMEDLVLKKDSIGISDEVMIYHVKVPKEMARKKSSIFLNNQVSAFDLQIREYQEPRKLDFIKLNYGDESVVLSADKLDKPVLYEKLLKEVSLSFDYDRIDKGDRFYGKQYLELEVKLVSPRGELKETFKREIVVCPGENTLRYANYDRSDCENSTISLNDVLNNKTYNLEGYSQIFLTVKHNPKYYSTAGYNRSIKIILKRAVIFDLQVSFPAGLLIKRFDQEGIGTLSGISIAAIAQLSFYDQLQIGKIKPYRIGVGFLAINAFNFSDNATVLRDVGAVAMGSFYPINRNSRFSFPLHTGVGYLMKQEAWFFMFGPGIEVRF